MGDILATISINSESYTPLFNECRVGLVYLVGVENIIALHNPKNWNRSNWRETLLRKLDELKPEIVIQLDQDERFEDLDLFLKELEIFKLSKAKVMFFDYKMVAEWRAPLYPKLAHCKVYKWQEGLTFEPYVGLALPTQYHKAKRYYAKVKILHYCFYTQKMYKEKMKQIVKEYPNNEHRLT